MISKSGNCLVMITSLKTIKKESLNEIDFGYLMIQKIIFVLCGYISFFPLYFRKKDNFILLCNIWSRVIIFSSSYFAMKGRARSFSPNNFKIITISRISREKLLLLLLLALSIYQSLYSFKEKKFHSWFFMSKPKNHNNKQHTTAWNEENVMWFWQLKTCSGKKLRW